MDRIRERGAAARRDRAGTRLAAEIKALLARGDRDQAADRFEELVARYQQRAARIACYYLRDMAEVDEAVQDAFLKTFRHLPSFRDDLLFDVWFTRIVVNGCLDRLKARARRARWHWARRDDEDDVIEGRPDAAPSPEAAVLARERRARVWEAVATLPARQRSVAVLSQFEGLSAREIGQVLGLREVTVRVHLFRAIRSLRARLQHDKAWLLRRAPGSGTTG